MVSSRLITDSRAVIKNKTRPLDPDLEFNQIISGFAFNTGLFPETIFRIKITLAVFYFYF